MRKTFLTFCTVALALLAVSSCGKIWDEFDAVHGEIDELKAKLEALEARLNSEISGLNTKISALETFKGTATETISGLVADLDALDGALDGKVSDFTAALEALQGELGQKYQELKGADAEILAALTQVAVTKVEKKDNGNVVLYFADGTSVEIPSSANASNEGFVTVVDGKWAVVGADGQTTVLDAEVHPDTKLTFKVNPETNELLYSVDGGELRSIEEFLKLENEVLSPIAASALTIRNLLTVLLADTSSAGTEKMLATTDIATNPTINQGNIFLIH